MRNGLGITGQMEGRAAQMETPLLHLAPASVPHGRRHILLSPPSKWVCFARPGRHFAFIIERTRFGAFILHQPSFRLEDRCSIHAVFCRRSIFFAAVVAQPPGFSATPGCWLAQPPTSEMDSQAAGIGPRILCSRCRERTWKLCMPQVIRIFMAYLLLLWYVYTTFVRTTEYKVSFSALSALATPTSRQKVSRTCLADL